MGSAWFSLGHGDVLQPVPSWAVTARATGAGEEVGSGQGQRFIHRHNIGIQQKEQGLNSIQQSPTVGHHEQFLQCAGGKEQPLSLCQLIAMALPAGFPLQDGDHHGGVQNHPGRPSAS